MGILVAQDILLGFLLALMPVLEKSGIEAASEFLFVLMWVVLFLIAVFLVHYPLLALLEWLNKLQEHHEIFLMACICACLLLSELGSLFRQQMELCSFVAGVIVATRKGVAETTLKTTQSLKEVFSALFFASIGLHIYPSFIVKEGLLLLALTILTILFKIVLTTVTMHILFRQSLRNSLTIGVGLCQISEFTFVLASKAKRYIFC